MPRTYEQLNEYERCVIAQMLKEGYGWSEIGRRLGRSASTIYREYYRNKGLERYHPRDAHRQAEARRRKPRRPRKIVGKVQRWVQRGLKQDWSPDQISGRGKLEGKSEVSGVTIYRYLERPEGESYRPYLRGPSKARKRNRKRRKRIHNQVMIDERPKEAGERKEAGHWEGDTVRGPMKKKACVMSLVERKSHYAVFRLLKERNGEHLNRSARRAMQKHPFKTLTVDHGMEFGSHQKLEELTGVSVYFAHKKKPWQRGLNEQVNGLLRHYFPRGTDFSRVSPAQLRRAEKRLNNRPRKSLGYKTPNEVMAESPLQL